MYSVKFSHLAARDLDEVFEYISDILKNPLAAEKLVLRHSLLRGMKTRGESPGRSSSRSRNSAHHSLFLTD